MINQETLNVINEHAEEIYKDFDSRWFAGARKFVSGEAIPKSHIVLRNIALERCMSYEKGRGALLSELVRLGCKGKQATYIDDQASSIHHGKAIGSFHKFYYYSINSKKCLSDQAQYKKAVRKHLKEKFG